MHTIGMLLIYFGAAWITVMILRFLDYGAQFFKAGTRFLKLFDHATITYRNPAPMILLHSDLSEAEITYPERLHDVQEEEPGFAQGTGSPGPSAQEEQVS